MIQKFCALTKKKSPITVAENILLKILSSSNTQSYFSVFHYKILHIQMWSKYDMAVALY